MQFQFSVLELATYRNLEVENFRLLTLKTSTFVVWGFNFEMLTLKVQVWSLKTQVWSFSLSQTQVWRLKFEDFHFRTLKFQVWSFSLSQFQVWRLKFEDFHFRSLKFEVFHFRFLSLSRRRPSLRVAGQATDISPLAVAFIPADGAQAKTIANHSSRFGSAFSVFRRSANQRSRLA